MQSGSATIASDRAVPAAGPAGSTHEASDNAAVWTRFATAAAGGQFCTAWLTILCQSLLGARTAFLLLDEGGGQYKVGAAWPDADRDLSYLAPAAELALRERRGLVHRAESDASRSLAQPVDHVAYPIDVGGHLHAVVVVDLGTQPALDRQAVLRQLHWGAGWLEVLFRRRQAEDDKTALDRTSFALDALAAVNDQDRLQAACMALVNLLATRLSCRRVSLGFPRRGAVRLAAISHSASFRSASHIVAAIENAMDEALDQASSLAIPPSGQMRPAATLAHETLARLSGAKTIASVPLVCAGRPVGLMTLERDDGELFDERMLALLDVAGGLLGPLFAAKRKDHRLFAGRAADAVRRGMTAVFGPHRPGAKLVAGAAVAGIAALALLQGDYRVSAKALVEAAQLHAVVAPFDSFVASAPVRAGDLVQAGQTLATLDERELHLDQLRAAAQVEEQVLKHNEALGKQDRVASLVTKAGLDEARAQLAIIDDKIDRSTLRSTARGVVISGDLSQMIGSPLQKGKMLFEVAPLDAYRVALQVDGRDITAVAVGETGSLVLAGLTNRSIPFAVRSITPIATPADGQNTFRVEGDLLDADDQLRPGMEGIGKIAIDRRPLLEIWLLPVVEWARMTFWTWWP